MNHNKLSAAQNSWLCRTGLPIPVLALMLSATAVAAPQDIDINCGQLPYQLKATTGTLLDEPVGVLNNGANSNIFWSFNAAPVGCGGASPSFTCNNVNIALPAPQGTPAPAASKVTVNGTPNLAGTFDFTLRAELETGGASCNRDYSLVIQQPFDLVFVLDRSGSMSSATHIKPPAQDRWGALKLGVNGFLPLLASTAPAGSRFGLSLFSTAEIPNSSFGNGLAPVDNDLPGKVAQELGQQNPDGWTAMGKGLKNGTGKLDDTARPRIVVLFTDGEQNENPLVNANGQGYSDGTKINSSYPAGPGSVKIITVGIGDPSGPDLTTLQNLGKENRGQTIITDNGASFSGACSGDIAAAFQCAIESALQGNSPQRVDHFSGTLSDPPTKHQFQLNKRVGQLLLQVSLDRELKFGHPQEFLNQLIGSGLKIERDGSDITANFELIGGGSPTNSFLLRLDFSRFDGQTPSFPVIPSEGTYVVQMPKGSGGSGDDGLAVTARNPAYQLIPYADDHRLAMAWQVNPAVPRVNQPLTPSLDLKWLGQPIANAQVRALILKPGDDLGDLLADNPLNVDVSSATDAGSPGHQKYQQLLANPAFLNQLLPQQQNLTLTHQGNGRYSAAYNPGDVSGVYQVLYRVEADDPAFGKLQRLAMESLYVRFGPVDLPASLVNTTVSGNTVTIQFRPKTTTGRFIGPGNGKAFTVDGLTLASVSDHQDGSYTLVLTGNPETAVAVKVLDEEIYRGKASEFGKPPAVGVIERICRWLEGFGLPCTLFWILVAILVLLALWLLFGKKAGNP